MSMSSPEDLAEFMMHQRLVLQPIDDVQTLERTSEGSHTQSAQEIVVADGARRGGAKVARITRRRPMLRMRGPLDATHAAAYPR